MLNLSKSQGTLNTSYKEEPTFSFSVENKNTANIYKISLEVFDKEALKFRKSLTIEQKDSKSFLVTIPPSSSYIMIQIGQTVECWAFPLLKHQVINYFSDVKHTIDETDRDRHEETLFKQLSLV